MVLPSELRCGFQLLSVPEFAIIAVQTSAPVTTASLFNSNFRLFQFRFNGLRRGRGQAGFLCSTLLLTRSTAFFVAQFFVGISKAFLLASCDSFINACCSSLSWMIRRSESVEFFWFSQSAYECWMLLHDQVDGFYPAADGQQCSDETTSPLQQLPGQ